MSKEYIAKESTAQQILNTSQNILSKVSSGGGGGTSSGDASISNTQVNNVSDANAYLILPAGEAYPSITTVSAALNWTDPDDSVVAGVKIKDWLGTRVVRKDGSVPQDENDGVVVVDTGIKNQYKDTPFVDAGLTVELGTNHHYYYRWFPYNVFYVYTPGIVKEVVTGEANTPTTIYVTKTALGLYPTHMEESLIFYNYTDGEVTVRTSNSNIVATIIGEGAGKTLHVSASYIVEGNYTVTLMQRGEGVFNGYGELVIPVTLTEDVNNITPATNTVSTSVEPELWQQMVNDGVVTSFFNVGDKIPIELNGTLLKADGTTAMTFDHDNNYYLSILGFNHNKSRESGSKDNIHFILGKNSSGKDICFFPGNVFQVNTSQTCAGGWNSSQIRTVTCNSFFNCLPPRWQLLIKATTKYQDKGWYNGIKVNNSSNIGSTSDKIFLLSPYEVTGNTYTLANTYEASYQQRYTYYANGNSINRYRSNNINYTIDWWSRSPALTNHCDCHCNCNCDDGDDSDDADNSDYYYDNGYWCSASNGRQNVNDTRLGFAPAFALIAD